MFDSSLDILWNLLSMPKTLFMLSMIIIIYITVTI